MGKKVIIISSSPRKDGDSDTLAKSFARGGKFSPSDVERLDRLQTVLFRCFESASVAASMKSLKMARQQNEPYPFPEESLNELFGKVR